MTASKAATLRRAAVMAIVSGLLALAAPASGEIVDPETCMLPDLHGPVFYDFSPGLSTDPMDPGTHIDIYVDDRPYYPFEDSWSNYINLVEVRVQQGEEISEPIRLQPETGRYNRVHQTFSVVIGPEVLTFGHHSLLFRARDDCGKVGSHTEEVFVVAPGLVATCTLPVDRLC